MQVRIINIPAFLFFCSFAFAQNQIKLSHEISGKVVHLKEGTKILYELNADINVIYRGTVKKINDDSTLVVDDKTLRMADIREIDFAHHKLMGVPLIIAGTTLLAAGFYFIVKSMVSEPDNDYGINYTVYLGSASVTAGGATLGWGLSRISKKPFVLGVWWHWELVKG